MTKSCAGNGWTDGAAMPDAAATRTARADEPNPSSSRPRRNDSSSVRRALRIADVLAQRAGRAGLSLAELAAELSISKSTVLRLLRPLLDTHLVNRTSTGTYQLGVQAVVLGQAYLETLDLRDAARAQLHELVSASGETVHLVVYDRPDVVYVDKVDSPSTVRMFSRVGARMPAYCTAVGKVFLADATEDEIQAVIAAGLPHRTPNTLTTEESLRSAIAQVAAIGYAVDDEENESEIRCVAAPIVDTSLRVISAVSVSGPAARMTPEKVNEMAPVVVAAAGRVSAQLGGHLVPADFRGPSQHPTNDDRTG